MATKYITPSKPKKARHVLVIRGRTSPMHQSQVKERFALAGSRLKKGVGFLAGLGNNLNANINAQQKKSKKKKGGFDFQI